MINRYGNFIGAGVKASPMKQLIKSSDFYLSADKADGQPWTKLEPRTLPNGVSNGEYLQNVSVDVVLQASDIASLQDNISGFARANFLVSTFNNMLNAGIETFGTHIYSSISVPRNNQTISAYQHYQYGSSAWGIMLPLGTTLAQAQALLAGTTIRYQLATPIDTLNSPFTNPWVDLSGVVGKNLLNIFPSSQTFTGITATINGDEITINGTATGNVFIKLTNGLSLANTTSSWLNELVLKANQNPVTLSVKDVSGSATSLTYATRITSGAFANFSFPGTSASATLNENILFAYCFIPNGATITNLKFKIQLELGSVATTYEPYGKANCLLNGFAGTTASGYKVETINGKTNVFLNLDGTNDFGQFANMDVLNPVGTDDFAQMVVFRPDDLSSAKYSGVVRNTDTTTTMQYGLLNSSTGSTTYNINGTSEEIEPVRTLALKYILFGRINGRRFANLNGVEVHESAFANSITARTNTQMCCRSASVDGLTKSTFGKGLQGDIAFWKGPQGTLDKDKIVSLVAKAMKQKYGLGV